MPAGDAARLFPSAVVLRAALAESLRALGLESVGFVFHSFRAGGALYLLNHGEDLREVLRRGRWRWPESARPYVQRLRALSAYTDIPQRTLDAGASLAMAPSLVLAEAFRGFALLQ